MAPNRPPKPPTSRHDSALSVHEDRLPKPPPRQPPSITALNATRSPLLALPAEIRLHIYSLLSPRSRLPTIARSRTLGVSSVSHRPPPLAFVLACRQLCAEALDHYYGKAVWRLEGLLDSANVWALWQVENALLASAVLERIRRVEIVAFWAPVPEGGVVAAGALASLYGLDAGYKAFAGVEKEEVVPWPYGRVVWEEVRRRRERVQRAVDVLVLARDLRTVVITWKEISRRDGEGDEGWEARKEVLRPLGKLRGWVRFSTGDSVAPENIVEGLRAFAKELNG